MRIAFVLPKYFNFPIGGYAVVYHYANHLVAHGHDVDIVMPQRIDGAGEPRSLVQRIKERLWPLTLRLRNRPLVSWFRIDPMIRFRLIHDWDDGLLADVDGAVATAWQTAEVVARATPRSARAFYLLQHYETWAGPKADVDATFKLGLHVIAISRWLQGIAEQLGSGEVSYVPNGLDHTRFRITAPVERQPAILTLNHDAAFKGVPDALAVLERIHAAFPAVPIRMFGVPERGPNIPEWIEYVRSPEPDALVELYNRSSIYLSASLAEGWALPPAEAMACGCLFVGTDSGGCRDFADDGRTALLSPPGDRDALYANLHRVLADTVLASRIRDEGTREVAKFTWTSSGETFRHLLEGSHDPQA